VKEILVRGIGGMTPLGLRQSIRGKRKPVSVALWYRFQVGLNLVGLTDNNHVRSHVSRYFA